MQLEVKNYKVYLKEIEFYNFIIGRISCANFFSQLHLFNSILDTKRNLIK